MISNQHVQSAGGCVCRSYIVTPKCVIRAVAVAPHGAILEGLSDLCVTQL